VIYLLLDLSRLKIKVRELVTPSSRRSSTFSPDIGVTAERRDGAPGVYVGEAKIAALGLKIKNGCSYHGLSLNVDMDLSPFAAINPCGYAGLKVIQTKRSQHSAHPPSEAGEQLSQHLLQQLDKQHG
jgi:lipoyl(octanoyl) transferase